VAMVSGSLLGLLLLGLVVVQAQDDAAAGGDGAAPAAGDDGGAGGEDGPDEAWEYVEFLKDEVNEKIENVLQDTLYTAREKTGLTALDETVADTMTQVMEVRQSILDRIKCIRKEEEGCAVDENSNVKQEQKLSELRMEIMGILLKLVDKDAASVEKLKAISQDLLKFQASIRTEIMRVLMLPTSEGRTRPPAGDCSQCEALKNITTEVENLIACAEKEEEPAGDEAEAPPADEAPADDAGGDSEVTETAECPPPEMFIMSLITMIESIDKEIENLYNFIIKSTDEEERSKFTKELQDYKAKRDTIDDLITKLTGEEDPEKIKKAVKRGLTRIGSELKSQLAECQSQCDTGGCDSCGADVLFEAVDKMEELNSTLTSGDSDEEKLENVRSEMIKYITDVNSKNRDILIQKAQDGALEQCEEEKRNVYETIKGPMWMLVNSTIFSGIEETQVMAVALIDLMKGLKVQFCGVEDGDPIRDIGDEGPNCQWEEYQQTKEYLEKIDDLIQDNLFKSTDDGSKLNAILGFVEIQSQFDTRVKKLFENELICSEEATFIKKTYMDQLQACMIEFMSPRVKFSEMSRQDRIQCTKNLRTTMETRMADLLRVELENSLNDIGPEASEVTEA